MADDEKAKSALEKLEAARKEARDAEAAPSGPGEPDKAASDEDLLSPSTVTATPGGEFSGDSPPADALETGAPASHDPETETEAETTIPDERPEGDALPDESGAPLRGDADTPGAAAPEPHAGADHDHHDGHDHAPHEEESRPISALILQWLAILLVGAVIALWAGPKIAPHLPAWAAPAAEFLTPGADRAREAADTLKKETDAALAAVNARIDALQEKAIDGEALNEAKAELSARIDIAAENGAPKDAESRIAALESGLASLKAEIETLRAAGGDGASEEAIAALGERLSALAEAEKKLTPLEERVAALETGEAATSAAKHDAESIRRAANLDAATTRIGEALAAGAPFEQEMTDAVALSGAVAPAPLAAAAKGGAPTQRDLLSEFPLAAREAYSAATEATAGGAFFDRLYAKLSGRIGGRPASETPGEDVGAVLSRVEARLREGRLGAAATEADALPQAAKDAAMMSAWLTRLDAAVSARQAFAEWRHIVGAGAKGADE